MELTGAVHHDIVRPGKASMFGRSQSCRERNQTPVSMKRLFVVNKHSAFSLLPSGVLPFPEGIEAAGFGGEQPPRVRRIRIEPLVTHFKKTAFHVSIRTPPNTRDRIVASGSNYVAFERRLT